MALTTLHHARWADLIDQTASVLAWQAGMQLVDE
jgi:hypothetical protein